MVRKRDDRNNFIGIVHGFTKFVQEKTESTQIALKNYEPTAYTILLREV